MSYFRNLLNTTDDFNGTVEVAPVRPAYVINAEMIKQCKVGKFVKPVIIMEA